MSLSLILQAYDDSDAVEDRTDWEVDESNHYHQSKFEAVTGTDNTNHGGIIGNGTDQPLPELNHSSLDEQEVGEPHINGGHRQTQSSEMHLVITKPKKKRKRIGNWMWTSKSRQQRKPSTRSDRINTISSGIKRKNNHSQTPSFPNDAEDCVAEHDEEPSPPFSPMSDVEADQDQANLTDDEGIPVVDYHDMVIHSQYRPFKCSSPKCAKTYKLVVHLKGHLRACHGIEKSAQELRSSLQFHTPEDEVDINQKEAREDKVTSPLMEIVMQDGGSATSASNFGQGHSHSKQLNRIDIAVGDDDTLGNKQKHKQVFRCPYCPTAFLNGTELIVHLRSHKKAELNPAKIFPQTASSPKQCNPRGQSIDLFLERFKLRPCRVIFTRCDKLISNHSKSLATSTTKMGTGGMKYHAMQCNDKKDSFIQMRRRGGWNQFECKTCSKTFPERWMARRHVIAHMNLRQFQCTQCSMRFSFNQTLQRHQQTHSGERNHRCPKCSKTFTTGSNLKRHILSVHEGVKRLKMTNFTIEYFLKIKMNWKGMVWFTTKRQVNGYNAGIVRKWK